MIDSYLLGSRVLDLRNLRDTARALGLPDVVGDPTDAVAFPIVQRVYAAVLPLPYRFYPRNMTASATWGVGRGSCYNKTNLFVALCRCAGVRAGYRMFRYRKTAFAAALGADHPLYQRISDATIHVLPVVWFRSRWVDIDCCDDPVYARVVHDYDPPLAWDGQDICNVEPQEVIADLGIWADLETLLDRPSRWTQEDFDQMNARIDRQIAAAGITDDDTPR